MLATSSRWRLLLRRRRLGRRSDFLCFLFEVSYNPCGSALLVGIGFVRTGLVGMIGHGRPIPGTGARQTAAFGSHVSTRQARRYSAGMGIQRKSTRPVGITNSSGQPEIVLEIDGLTISMTPPGPAVAPVPNDGGERDVKEGDR